MVSQYTQYDRLPEYLFDRALLAIEAGRWLRAHQPETADHRPDFSDFRCVKIMPILKDHLIWREA
jgi:hypothetical protein